MRFWRGFGGFWGGKTLPKPSPNPSKIKILKNMQFGIVFCLIFPKGGELGGMGRGLFL